MNSQEKTYRNTSESSRKTDTKSSKNSEKSGHKSSRNSEKSVPKKTQRLGKSVYSEVHLNNAALNDVTLELYDPIYDNVEYDDSENSDDLTLIILYASRCSRR